MGENKRTILQKFRFRLLSTRNSCFETKDWWYSTYIYIHMYSLFYYPKIMHFFYDKLLTYRIVALLSPGCLLGLFLLSVVLQNTHTRSRHTRSFAAHALLACVPEYENRATYFKRQAKYDTREFRSHFGRPKYLSIYSKTKDISPRKIKRD